MKVRELHAIVEQMPQDAELEVEVDLWETSGDGSSHEIYYTNQFEVAYRWQKRLHREIIKLILTLRI